MKRCNLLIPLLFQIVILAVDSNAYDYETLFFTQKVDNFGYGNNDTFSLRYLLANQSWTPGGPIFFYTGNEGDITMFANNTGLMWELAPKFKAMIIFAEHRYYGMSLPYGSQSFSNPQYNGYLTSEQALADFAVLINHLKGTIPHANESAVIAFGGSYGGMLAAWMRMKYPHIINGALASSAPVAQFTDLTPCNVFSKIVTSNFQSQGSACVKSIRNSWKAIRKLGMSDDGLKWLTSNFQLCDQITEKDVDTFANWISETWSYLAMTNYPYPTAFLAPLPENPVKEVCKYLTNATLPDKQLLQNIFKAVSVFHNYTGQADCFNLSQTGASSLGAYGWYYQSCTEMVMPMCRDGINDMFEPNPWNFTAFSEGCLTQWKVKPDAYKAVIMYGGRDISAASNIIFSNGKLDPWSGGGILKSLSRSLIAIEMDHAAHHLDLRAANPADPQSVVKARRTEARIISQWTKYRKC